MFVELSSLAARVRSPATLASGVLFGLLLTSVSLPAFAVNPPPEQLYYVTLPEDDLLTLFDENQDTLGSYPQVVSPIRSVTTISINETGSLIYWDQWEDGGYDADIANPGANVYNASTNPDGTQIWGDSNPANGCPPNISGAINPCAAAADDLLQAGKVIVLDNDVVLSTGRYNVLDQFSTAAYNNNNGNTNWATNWTETGDTVAAGNYRDEFASVSYSNNNGSINWSNSWQEVNENDGANAGDVRITGGELRIGEDGNAGIYRTANLTGASSATLTFDFRETGSGTGIDDEVTIQVSTSSASPPAAASWVDLGTINDNDSSGSRTYDLTSYISATTSIRFIITSTWETSEFVYLDNVNIDVGGASGPGGGDLQITGGQLRFTETEAADSIQRQVNIPVNGGVTSASFARLKFFLGYSTVELDGSDEFRVDVSPDGTTWTTLATYGSAAGNPPANPSSQSFDIGANLPTGGGNLYVRFYQVDALEAGEYWYVDDVRVEWGYYRDPGQVYYDGRDKVGSTSPVAMSRGAFPPTPGSVMAGASEMFATSQWGTYYVSPLGEDTNEANNDSFEDVRWFIMAGAGGSTIDVDANGDGDLNDANDLNDYVMIEGGRIVIDGINDGATLSVVAGNPVQVNLMTADDNDTFEFRWDALVPPSSWSNDYYSPIGTTRTGAAGTNGCTEVWVYNPNGAQITVSWDRPGGSLYPTADGSFNVPANSAAVSPSATNLLTNGNGARFWTANGALFLPISVTDCTRENSNGRLMDWGSPLVPAHDLTSQVLVGLAPGCSNESHSGICHDPDSTAGGTTPDITGNDASRNVVFVTAVADTNIYVDTNGSGLTCTPGSPPTVTGAERFQTGATALTSYRFTDDPTTRSYVHDNFATQSFSRSDSVDGWTGNQTWSRNWSEGGGETGNTPSSGAILINISSPATLRFQDDGGANESGRTIQRNHDTTGATFARLSFQLFSSTGMDANDRIAVEVTSDGTNWVTLETYVGPWSQTLPGPDFPRVEVFNISPYASSLMFIRFRILDDLEAGDWWAVDHVHIDYASGGDFNMSGALIRSFNADCSGTPIAAAYGQYPSLTGGNDDEALDFGTLVPPYRPAARTGSIGNYLWLDEDGDGEQDAGEPGIPNVKVTLTGTATDGTVYNLTTYTDASGGYIFTGIKAGTNYTVTVDQTTLPAGLRNPTYDEDNGTATDSIPGSPDNATVVSLGAGVEYLTADFGYNWNPTADVVGNTGTGTIGDRVWIDADGDGVQDPNEIGLYNIPVQLITAGPDGLFGTVDDLVAASTTTDHNGNYIFDELLPGAYVVRVNGGTTPAGYTQTGDMDSTLDNRTTAPIVLAPGDVFVNADFGYQPTGGTTGSIGDLVWVDSDRDNTKDAGEPGIPGVTVSLIKDLDGDGTWDVGEPIIATDITDENGIYGFSGLPVTDGAGTDDYLVWVNDTNNVLGELTPTYDVRDGGSQGNPNSGVVTGLEISAVTSLTTTAVTNADFAYAPSGHDSGEGLIGDTIFLDRDGDGAFDPGEGLEGVTVDLRNSSGQLVGTTVTNENGQYFFGGLPADTYTVRVSTTTLPGGGTDLTNTVDPDTASPGNNQSSVTITAGGINLAQDFGYRDTTTPNSISGTLWEDTNADGTLPGSGEAGRFANVTLALYFDRNGNGVLDGSDNLAGTTNTDGSGNYSFTNLPNGTYFVDVTDDNNILNGYWKSDGPNAGSDNNSQIDPYKVTVSGGQTNTTADFGYYNDPAGLGNFVWNDTDRDGVQDGGELGIGGVEVTLTIAYPGGLTTVVKTLTDASGFYSFGNLLLDENFDGVGAGEPLYSISVATPAGMIPSPQNATTEALDSDDPAGQPATVTEGAVNDTYDFGFYGGYALLGDRVWYDTDGDGFQDAGEVGISGVRVYINGSGSGADCQSGCTVTTGPNGLWQQVVAPGNYVVTFEDADISALGYNTQPTNMTSPNDTYIVTAAAGDVLDYLDFGFNGGTTGSIGNFVWQDSNGNGSQDGGEPGIQNVTLALYTDPNGDGNPADGSVVGTTTTDANGSYQFTGVVAGNYVVVVTDTNNVVGGLTETGEGNQGTPTGSACGGSCDNRIPLVLSSGGSVQWADFGYRSGTGPGSIGNLVWRDLNGDGDRDAGEPGLEGAVIRLYSGATLVATTVTDPNGNYLFANLPLGTYSVDIDQGTGVLAGFTKTTGTAGADNNSQADPYSVTLTEVSPSNLTADFGFDPGTPYSISGTVFEDAGTSKGTYDVPPTGNQDDATVPGATVTLYRVVNGQEYLIDTKITPANGFYQFTDLPPGTYVVKVDTSGTDVDGFEQTVDPDQVGVCTICDSQTTVTIVNANITDRNFGYWNGDTITTPISLSYFKATAKNGMVTFDWHTATETANIGFRLLVWQGDRWVLIEEVPSQVINSRDEVIYSFGPVAVQGRVFAIADVDLKGKERRHGPFQVNRVYGVERAVPEQTNWRGIAKDHKDKHNKRQKARKDKRINQPQGLENQLDREEREMRKSLKQQGQPLGLHDPQTPSGWGERLVGLIMGLLINSAQAATPTYTPEMILEVGAEGLHRVTYEQLRDAGADLAGLRVGRIALRLNGQPLARYVKGQNGNATQARFFGPGGYVEFIGQPRQSLYGSTNHYTLSVGAGVAADENTTNLPKQPVIAAYYLETTTLEPQQIYNPIVSGDDPWYASDLLAWGGSATANLSIGVDNYLTTNAPRATVAVNLWGGSDWPSAPDHHAQLSLNGQPVAEGWFDGFEEHTLSATLSNGVLQEGANELILTLPRDTGAEWDLVSLNRWSVTYPRRFVARDGRLKFTAAAQAFKVKGLPTTGDVEVYRQRANGALERLTKVKRSADTATFAGLLNEEATYYVAAEANLHTATLALPVERQNITGGQAGYLIIAHPDFIGDPLDSSHPLNRLKSVRAGYGVKVVDVEQIYAQFGHYQFDPQAIKSYIAWAHANLGVDYVLLVGGDTYDYHHYISAGVSFIPSLYARTDELVRFAPVDPLYADVNGDLIPDLALGRLPVRTSAELATQVQKILDYEGRHSGGNPYGNKSVFAADRYDSWQAYSFTQDAEGMIAKLPPAWQPQVTEAFIDTQGVAGARNSLIGAINGGVALTSFVGHSDSWYWSFDDLFNGWDAASLSNAGRPTVVTQWGCWNTYYVDPLNESLAGKLLGNPNGGAATVLGATTLTDATHERDLAKLVYEGLFNPGTTLGEAVLLAKQAYGAEYPERRDVILGWNILGDPAVVIQP